MEIASRFAAATSKSLYSQLLYIWWLKAHRAIKSNEESIQINLWLMQTQKNQRTHFDQLRTEYSQYLHSHIDCCRYFQMQCNSICSSQLLMLICSHTKKTSTTATIINGLNANTIWLAFYGIIYNSERYGKCNCIMWSQCSHGGRQKHWASSYYLSKDNRQC